MTQNIDWKWVGLSVLILFICQLIVNFAFTIFGIITLGFGFLLFLVAKPIAYFIGGVVTGIMSPGETVIEPAIGAAIVAVLGIVLDAGRLYPGRMFGVIISGGIAFFIALVGARVGESMSANR